MTLVQEPLGLALGDDVGTELGIIVGAAVGDTLDIALGAASDVVDLLKSLLTDLFLLLNF